jgi:hypothetical protein
MAKVRRSTRERSRRWHHVTVSSEDLLAVIPDLRESVEELRELSAESLKLGNQQAHDRAEARILTAKIRALAKRAAHPDHTEAFLAQELSVKRVWKAWAVLARALGSPLALYFATPAQYNASAAASPAGPSAISR